MSEIRIVTADQESIPVIGGIAAAAIRAVYPGYYPEEKLERSKQELIDTIIGSC